MNETTMSRREMLASLASSIATGLALGTLLPSAAHAEVAPAITVYKDPSCGCCAKWVEHLRAAGFKPSVRDRSDMDALKDSLGVPAALRSCHTAVTGKFVIEGHVPADDLKRLVARAPKGVLGIAVPNMPAGAPGMEMPGRRDRYDVIAFASNGTTSVFARH
jgi:Predicted metal-binding protein